jgi:lipopolysaccharide export system permease protein
MKSITRYIFGQLVVATLFVTFAVTSVVWLSQSLRFIDLIVNRGLSVVTFVELTGLLLPSILGLILPIALFCAVLYTYNRLTVDSELVVLRAAGLSQIALARPALLLAVIVAILGYGINLFLMPLGYREFKDRQSDLRSDSAHVFLQEGTFNTLTEGLTVFVRAREPNGELVGILVHDSRNMDTPVTMMAERGALVSTDAGPRILLINGTRQELRREDRKLNILYFDRYSFDLTSLIPERKNRWREPRERYLDELFGEPQHRSDINLRDELRAEGHQRLVSPLYAFAFAMIGLATALGGQFNRRGRLARIAAGAVAAIVFQGAALLLANLIATIPALTPLAYALPPVAFIAALIVLLRGQTARRAPLIAGLEPGAV